MLKANIINESLDCMLRNIINESKLNEDNLMRDGIEEEIRSSLEDAVSKLMEDRVSNLKQYEIAMQDALEKVFPELSWWEVTSTNIFMDLFEKRDPWAVVEDIMNTLTISDEEEEDQEYTPSLTSDDMNSGQWYESLKEAIGDGVKENIVKVNKKEDITIHCTGTIEVYKNDFEYLDDPIIKVDEPHDYDEYEGKIYSKEYKGPAIISDEDVMDYFVTNNIYENISNSSGIYKFNIDLVISVKWSGVKHQHKYEGNTYVYYDNVEIQPMDNINYKTLNFSLTKVNNESLKESKRLDEKIPKDLSRSMRNDFINGKYSYRKDSSRFNTDNMVGADKVVDYENSNYRVLFPQEVLGMKKRGEDLSNIYVIDNNGDHIKLDSEGHPTWDSADKRGLRVNQSLNKTLANAKKIYIADEKFVKDTQPEKFAQRHQDPEERNANMNLGAYRDDKFDEDRYRKGMYTNDHKSKKAIERAKQDFEDGDISRKEMERIIANNSPQIDTYYGRSYQDIRDRKADFRNYTANKTASAKVSEYKELKQSIPEAERAISRAKDDIEKFNNGQSTSGWSDYGYNKISADRYRKEIEDLEKKLEFAKRQLQSYESKLTDDAKGSELKSLEDKLAKANDDLEAKTARLKALLRKNEALRRNNKAKNLSEAKDLSKVESSMTSILEKNLDKINNCSTVKEIASAVKNILDKNNIDTKASQRLIKNIEKQKSLMGAFSTVYNSCLAGEDQSTIKLKKTYK